MFRYLFSLLLLLALGWGGYALAARGWYPIAVVNFRPITAAAFDDAAGTAITYYQKMKKPEVSQDVFEKEIRRAAFDKLIENRLLYGRVDETEINQQLAALIGQNKDLEKNSEAAYGLPFEKFKDAVLRPQIAIELLQRELGANGGADAWLLQEKKNARVWIYDKAFRWDGEKVALR